MIVFQLQECVNALRSQKRANHYETVSLPPIKAVGVIKTQWEQGACKDLQKGKQGEIRTAEYFYVSHTTKV